MAATEYTSNYGYEWQGYPIYAQDNTIEGSFKRYTSFPGPKEVFDFALLGLPKYFPLTGEMMTPEIMIPYLESAITEIEMDMGCNLSEVTHLHSADYIADMFSANYSGINLTRWPVTSIVQFRLRYPHTGTPNPYQTYAIPATWVYLKKNKVNVIAGVGTVNISTTATSVSTGAGLLTYINGFGQGYYQPGMIEVIYTAGFKQDKLPSMVADLIKTWAALRFLGDIIPVLFPTSSVNVAIDSVSQGATIIVPQLLAKRLEDLEKKKNDLKRAFKKGFGLSVAQAYIGS